MEFVNSNNHLNKCRANSRLLNGMTLYNKDINFFYLIYKHNLRNLVRLFEETDKHTKICVKIKIHE